MDQYKVWINELMDECKDTVTLELVWRILVKLRLEEENVEVA